MISLVVIVLRILVGLIIAVSGRRLLATTPALAGMLLGGLLGMILVELFLPLPANLMPYQPFIGFGIGGLLGALLAVPLTMVIGFLSAVAFGAVVGWMIGMVINFGGNPTQLFSTIFSFSFIQSPIPILLSAVLGVAVGVLSIFFPNFMIMISTAFLGMAIVVTELPKLLGSQLPLLNNGVILVFVWLVLGFLSTFLQNTDS